VRIQPLGNSQISPPEAAISPPEAAIGNCLSPALYGESRFRAGEQRDKTEDPAGILVT
jgi:hypothetical protein